MIRSTTPLPRRPTAERDSPWIVDLLLAVMRGRRPMTSGEIVTLVRAQSVSTIPIAAIDIRLMLQPPFFRLTDQGWVCTWKLPFEEPES